MDVSEANPFKSWLSDPAWNDILALCELPAFKDFKQNFKTNAIKWEEAMNVNSPMDSISALLGDGMDGFKKLCVLRCIRPDAVVRERERYSIYSTPLCSVIFCSILFCSLLFHSILFYSILFQSVLESRLSCSPPFINHSFMLNIASNVFPDLPVFITLCST